MHFNGMESLLQTFLICQKGTLEAVHIEMLNNTTYQILF